MITYVLVIYEIDRGRSRGGAIATGKRVHVLLRSTLGSRRFHR
jgi:hypothetical protein